MKHFYLGLLIFCLLLSACYLGSRTVTLRSEGVLEPLQQALRADAVGDRADRARLLDRAQGSWNDSALLFAALLSHERTDQVTLGFSKLQCAGDDDFACLCGQLILKLRGIAEMDRPRLANIF